MNYIILVEQIIETENDRQLKRESHNPNGRIRGSAEQPVCYYAQSLYNFLMVSEIMEI